MKEENCDIIKDLLPGYIDKTSSEATNNLIEKHLQTCKNCTSVLEDMNKDIDSELFEQKEQIDYLKGYRKNKIIAIIKTILICIIIILSVFLILQQIEEKCEFFVDVNSFNISYNREETLDDNTKELQFGVNDKKFNLYFKYNETNGKDIYIETVGKASCFGPPSRTILTVNIKENTERVFLRDKKGNIKEIWNKNSKLPL